MTVDDIFEIMKSEEQRRGNCTLLLISTILIAAGILLITIGAQTSPHYNHAQLLDVAEEFRALQQTQWGLIIDHQLSLKLTQGANNSVEWLQIPSIPFESCLLTESLYQHLEQDHKAADLKRTVDLVIEEVGSDLTSQFTMDCGSLPLFQVVEKKNMNWRLCKLQDAGNWADHRCQSLRYLHLITAKVRREGEVWAPQEDACEMEWRTLPKNQKAAIARLQSSPRVSICTSSSLYQDQDSLLGIPQFNLSYGLQFLGVLFIFLTFLYSTKHLS